MKQQYYPEQDGMADRLKQLKGQMTDERLAEILGVERKTANRMVNGYGFFSTLYVIKICKYFNVSADWFIFGTEKE